MGAVRAVPVIVGPAPSTLSSVSVSPASVVSGTSVTGTVTVAALLSGTATVALTSSSSAVSVPELVTVSAGKSAAAVSPGVSVRPSSTSFVITTTAVPAPTTATITATFRGVVVTTTLVLTPAAPILTSIVVSPASVTGGTSVAGTVTLSGPAPANGLTINLTSDNAAATVPVSVPIVAGATSVSFPVMTKGVGASAIANITATSGGASKSSSLTVNSAVVITSINNGDTLTDDRTVSANVLTNNGLVTLVVDGVDISTENVVLVPGHNSSGFPLETNSFPNGSHLITIRDAFGNTDTRTVTFSNALSNLNYNPMFDRTPGVTDIANTCHITGTFSTSQSWTVNISDDSNNPVNTFSGNGTAVDATWNGTNSKGQVMPADDYLVTITGSGTASQSSNVAGAAPNGANSPISKTFLVNIDNYADSIILLHIQTFQSYSNGTADTVATARSKAIAYKHFLHAELDRFVGTDFNYPVLVSILDDYDFVHDPKLVGRIQNKFRRPATFVYIDADGDYHDYNGTPLSIQTSGGANPGYYTHYPTIHPYFELGGYRWCSQYASNQVLSPKDINVGTLTASAGYTSGEGVAGNGPFVWIDTCDSTAGDGIIGPGNNLIGNDPVDYQWASDFGINGYGFGGGVYFGSVLQTPRIYISGLPGRYGEDWSYWRQNLFDFLCAGGNNFQTALRRSYDIQSFTTQPTPPNAMVWTGFGQFAL